MATQDLHLFDTNNNLVRTLHNLELRGVICVRDMTTQDLRCFVLNPNTVVPGCEAYYYESDFHSVNL